MENSIIFSIIMATYNSERTIEKALKSIRRQKFDQSKIEILVIDGGSTDSTIKIAEKYGANVINNPVRLPEPAKVIGLKHAKGKYICIMDSDEVVKNPNMFEMRYKALINNPSLKCLAIGLDTPRKSQPCCYYINAVGDPFSCFVYKTYQDGMEGLIKNKAVGCDNGIYIGRFKENEIRPIGDSGTVMDREFIFDNYTDNLEKETTSTIFDRIINDTQLVGYIEGDKHLHYTTSTFRIYLKKLKFRITNNIFNVSGSGYANKAQNNRTLDTRKYLYPLYSISVVFPIIDGVRMSINYKHWVFLLHPIFTWYVMAQIAIQYVEKLCGINKSVDKYG